MGGSVGVQLVEISDTHGKVGIREEFNGLGLGAVGEQRGDVLLDGPLFQELGEGFCTL